MNMKISKLVISTLILNHATVNAQIPDGLVGYTHYLELAPIDNTGTSIVGSIGSWSWEDRDLGENVFWRHQSDWIAIRLTEPSNLNLEVVRNNTERDSSKLFPSFTLYNSFNDSAEGAHFGDNTSDIQWDDNSQLLTYLEHLDNSTFGTINETITLPAGDYTILLGGNATAEASPVMVDYTATFSVTPIPESSTTILGLLAGFAFLAHRKRSTKH